MLYRTDRCPDFRIRSQLYRRSVAFLLLFRGEIYHSQLHCAQMKVGTVPILSTYLTACCSRERAWSWQAMASSLRPSLSSTIALLYQASGSSGPNGVALSKAAYASFK